jgi:hypothetical protein
VVAEDCKGAGIRTVGVERVTAALIDRDSIMRTSLLLVLAAAVVAAATLAVAPNTSPPMVPPVGGAESLDVKEWQFEAPASRLALGTTAIPWRAAPVGATFDYALDVRGDATAAGPLGPMAIGFRARWTWTVLARGDDRIALEVELADVDLDLPAQPAFKGIEPAAVREALAARVVALMDGSGRILGFRSADGAPSAGCDAVRGLVLLTSFVTMPASEAFVEELPDTRGCVRARFQWSETDAESATLTRSSLGFSSLRTPGNFAEVQLNGGGRAVFRADLGWLAQATIDERMVATESSVLGKVDARTRIEVELRGHGCRPLSELSEVDLNAPWQSPEEALRTKSDSAAFAKARLAEVIDLRVADLCACIERCALAGDHRSREFRRACRQLRQTLRFRPETLAELQAYLNGARDPYFIACCLSALGAVDRADARAAMATYLASSDPAFQLAAARGLFQARPDDVLLRTLQQVADAGSVERDVRTTMLLLQGTWAASLRKTGDERAQSLTDALLAREPSAAEDVAGWLAALGNVRGPEVLAVLSRYAANPAPDLRAAAAAALSGIDGTHALALASDLAQRDPFPVVRRRAVLVLGERQHDAARRVILDRLAADESATVRKAAVDALARDAGIDSVYAALDRCAQTDADAGVRKRAAVALAKRRA